MNTKQVIDNLYSAARKQEKFYPSDPEIKLLRRAASLLSQFDKAYALARHDILHADNDDQGIDSDTINYMLDILDHYFGELSGN